MDKRRRNGNGDKTKMRTEKINTALKLLCALPVKIGGVDQHATLLPMCLATLVSLLAYGNLVL